jgi:hypothetical protein
MNEQATAVFVGGPVDGGTFALQRAEGRVEVVTRADGSGFVLAVYSLVGGRFTLPDGDRLYRYAFAGYEDRRHDAEM